MVAKIFKSGNSRAIRIPKGVLENTKFVEIKIEGDRLIIEPKKTTLDELYEQIEKNREFTQDFLNDRNQPKPQERELF